MEQRISLITLGVSDLARSRRFYEALGWKASAASNDAVAFFDLGGVILSLFGRTALAEDAGVPGDGEGFRAVSLAHNVRRREEADALVARAREAGATVLKAPQDTFWGGYAGYFADPDGHLWEVAWNPHFPIDAEGRTWLPDSPRQGRAQDQE